MRLEKKINPGKETVETSAAADKEGRAQQIKSESRAGRKGALESRGKCVIQSPPIVPDLTRNKERLSQLELSNGSRCQSRCCEYTAR